MSGRLLVGLVVLLTACTGTTESTTTTASPGEPSTTTSSTLATSTTTTLTPPEVIPSADEILADGVVTDEERELARWAVYTCVVAAGAETTFELYDVDPVVTRDFFEELDDCRIPYVGLYRENRGPADRFDLGLLGVVECTEDQTGRDYGAKTVDEIGRLTPESHQTITRALNTDRSTYQGCYFDLYIAESRVVVEPDIIGYQLDGDPRRILLRVDGCGYITTGHLEAESDHSVFVRVSTVHIENGPLEPCWLLHPIRLREPLGDRRLIHNDTREEVEAMG